MLKVYHARDKVPPKSNLDYITFFFMTTTIAEPKFDQYNKGMHLEYCVGVFPLSILKPVPYFWRGNISVPTTPHIGTSGVFVSLSNRSAQALPSLQPPLSTASFCLLSSNQFLELLNICHGTFRLAVLSASVLFSTYLAFVQDSEIYYLLL